MEKNILQLINALQLSLEDIKGHAEKYAETVSVAESVTSGCIQLMLSAAEDAQRFFQGGITVYNCAQKAIHLNVEPIFATNCNGVDIRIAREMALNTCKLFKSQIGIAITGYATRNDEIKDLYAYIALVRNNDILFEGKITPTPENEGAEAQLEYAAITIKKLADVLRESCT